MSDFKIITNRVIPQKIGENSTTQQLPLGTKVDAEDRATTAYGVGTFIYAKGVASTAVGSWVTINEDDWSTALLAANAKGRVATAMAATVAGEYGWYQVSGKAVGKALASYADNALVYATATAGSIDDAAVSGDRVKKAIGASAVNTPSTGLAEFEIDYPFMDDGSAA
jgi:hypothetical protein